MSKPASLYVPDMGASAEIQATAWPQPPYSNWGPRVIRYKSDVMSLPEEAVVMSDSGIVWQLGKHWYMVGCADPFPPDAITLPAKVLSEGIQ